MESELDVSDSGVRDLYEKHPYPATDDRALEDDRWPLAPVDWICAVWNRRREQLNGLRILIAGCGAGAEAFRMRRRFGDAEIVAVDFSVRSIEIAKSLQQRTREMRSIAFSVADLASPSLQKKLGRRFDFISCHGVLSYVSAPQRVIQNLGNCLKPDGALYVGVNGTQHRSVGLRRVLSALGTNLSRIPERSRDRLALQLCDAIQQNRGEARVANFRSPLLATDVFGPRIHNLSLNQWVGLARNAQLHFRGSFTGWWKMRPALNTNLCHLLMPRCLGEVCQLMDKLEPSGFHRALFMLEPETRPPWDRPEELFRTHPLLTSMYKIKFPEKSSQWERMRKVTLRSPATNTRVDLKIPEWEVKILRESDGNRPLSSILKTVATRVPQDVLREQLYILHQLLVLTVAA